MMDLLGESAFLDNEERFEADFGPPSADDIENEQDDDEKEEMKKQRRKAVMKQKGQEWNDLFGDEANDDDDFKKIGMSLNPNVVKSKEKKTRAAADKDGAAGTSAGAAVKLFTQLYKSDIILASPIGLKMATTKDEGDDDEEEAASDIDYLSSIDICIVARSDVLAMQNWDHVNSVLECLNRQPRDTSNIDFSRVRNYFLEGQGENWRQLIMVSKFADPYILSSFRRYGKASRVS
jgi:U3 small nucleolar RNA-associated protein 25